MAKKQPDPKKIKAETKGVLHNYYLSDKGRFYGLNDPKNVKNDGTDVMRAMDIVGNRAKMVRDYEKGKKTGTPPPGVSKKVFDAMTNAGKKKK